MTITFSVYDSQLKARCHTPTPTTSTSLLLFLIQIRYKVKISTQYYTNTLYGGTAPHASGCAPWLQRASPVSTAPASGPRTPNSTTKLYKLKPRTPSIYRKIKINSSIDKKVTKIKSVKILFVNSQFGF